MAVSGRARVGVAIVVPALPVSDQSNENIVAAVLVGRVVAVAPPMRNRVDRPGLMPDRDGAYEHTPDEKAQAELNGLHRGAPDHQRGSEAAEEEHRPGYQDDPQLPQVALEPLVEWIAQNVACVALVDPQPIEVAVFDDDPAHVAPEEIDQRAVWVGLLVGVLVVAAVDRNPARRSVLQAAKPKERERVLEPFRAAEAAVGEQAMITEVNAEHAEHVVAHDRKDHAGPAEKPWHQRQQREQVVADQEYGGKPNDAAQADGGEQRQRFRAGPNGPHVNSLTSQGRLPPERRLGSWPHYRSQPAMLSTRHKRGLPLPGYQGARPMT